MKVTKEKSYAIKYVYFTSAKFYHGTFFPNYLTKTCVVELSQTLEIIICVPKTETCEMCNPSGTLLKFKRKQCTSHNSYKQSCTIRGENAYPCSISQLRKKSLAQMAAHHMRSVLIILMCVVRSHLVKCHFSFWDLNKHCLI